MGTWGTGIFANDDAVDLRSEFRDRIVGGASAEEASILIIDGYCIGGGAGANVEDDIDNINVFLALAAVQHQTGHVVPRIIELALRKIESPKEDLDRFEDLSDRKARAKVLERLGEKLRESAPAPKTIRPRKKATTDLLQGQHLVITDPESGARLLLRVSTIKEDQGGCYPACLVLDWDGDDETLKQADALLPSTAFERGRHFWKESYLVGRKPKKEYLQLLDARIQPPQDPREKILPSGIGETLTHVHRWEELFEVTGLSVDNPPLSMRAYRLKNTTALENIVAARLASEPARPHTGLPKEQIADQT